MTVHVGPDAIARSGQEISRPNGCRNKQPRGTRAGFVPRHPRLHGIYNRGIGALALLVTSPVLLLVAIALFVTQGPSIIYGGERLGKDRKPFRIFKFRTLDSAKARVITADKVLPVDSNIETPLGKFLRASRLDELPQLFNIVRGDMNIVGPRPAREELACIEEARNPHYAIRFSVKPGLVGQTQAYMCHGSSKPIRAKYNYTLCVNHVNYTRELVLFIRVGLAVLGRAVSLIGEKLRSRGALKAACHCARKWDLTLFQNNRPHHVLGYTECGGLCLADRALSGPAELLIRTHNGGLRRAKIDLTPLAFSTNPLPSHSFECTTDLSAHLVARFLRDAAVVGPRPARKAAALDPMEVPGGLRAPAE